MQELETLLAKLEDNHYAFKHPRVLRYFNRAYNKYGTTKDHMTALFNTHITPGKNKADELEKRFLNNLRLHLDGS